MFSSSGTPSFVSAPILPPYALASARLTACKSRLAPTLISVASRNCSCALVTLPVPRVSVARACESSPPLTVLSISSASTNCKVAAIAWSVAPVVRRNWSANSLSSRSASAAACAALNKVAPSPTIAPVAAIAPGTNAFFIRNAALSLAVPSDWNSLTARSTPLPAYCVMIGISTATG